jgi:carbamoyl-phosphate synthase large subunit
MNILISCVGRQVQLVDWFAQALGGKGQVFVADADSRALAMATHAPRLVSPSISDSAFPDWMLTACAEHEIRLLLSLLVDELVPLVPLRDCLAQIGCRLVAAPASSVEISRDKFRTAAFCKALGLRHPRTWCGAAIRGATDVPFPLLAKARFGRGGRGQRQVENFAALQALLQTVPDLSGWLFQERLEGVEYGLDIVNDLDGRHAATLVRRKYRMRNGETDMAQTVEDSALAGIGAAVGTALSHQGPLDADVIRTEDGDHVLDMNLRFGGGYAFSHMAGANVPAAMVQWALGRQLDTSWLKANAGIVGARSSVITPVCVGYP